MSYMVLCRSSASFDVQLVCKKAEAVRVGKKEACAKKWSSRCQLSTRLRGNPTIRVKREHVTSTASESDSSFLSTRVLQYFRSRSSSSLLPRTIFSNPPSLRLNRLYHSEQDTEEANEIINAINAKQFVAGLPSISKKWRRSTNVLRRRS